MQNFYDPEQRQNDPVLGGAQPIGTLSAFGGGKGDIAI
jgi:hypothetical protein